MMQKALFPGYTVGPDAYEDIVNICSAYGKKAAIIGGRKALAAAESQIRKAVEGSGIEITGTFWYGGEASRENMDMLRPQVADADMIFAVGGGKAIDTCKVLAHETNRPFFTFPTIASTCASCTSLGIVYHPDGSLREYSFSKIPPNHIFINTEIIANSLIFWFSTPISTLIWSIKAPVPPAQLPFMRSSIFPFSLKKITFASSPPISMSAFASG